MNEEPSPKKAKYAWAVLRVALGWIFLWPFLDKTLGLGYATPSSGAWIHGGHPTRGFLGGVDGWFAGAFNAMADSLLVEWLFMLGLLLIGLSLILGIGVRVGCYAGALMLLLMYLAELPFRASTADGRGANNPFLDDHIVYGIALIGLSLAQAGRTWSLGAWWSRRPIVQKHPWLE